MMYRKLAWMPRLSADVWTSVSAMHSDANVPYGVAKLT